MLAGQRSAAAACTLVAVLSCGATALAQPRQPWCGTAPAARFEAQATQAVPPGTLLRVLQEPAVVSSDYKGRIRHELAVLGDFESVDFEIQSFRGLEAFSVERQDVYVNPQGDVISFFEVEGTLAEWLVLPWSWEIDLTSPLVFSELLYLGPAASPQPIFMPLALMPRKLPRSKVTRLDSRLQYASHVVNVAIPELHQRQIDEPPALGFDPREVIDLVRGKLGETAYDEFGLGLWQHEMTNPGAFHVSAQPGSPDPAYSVYTSVAFYARELWTHEIDHNWNFRYDLPELVGWNAPFDGAHSRGTVATDAGLLCCGGYPKRRSQGRWRTEWTRDSHPFHPLELFAMGLIGAAEVPDMWVFKRQDLRDFQPGEVLAGPTRRLSVDRVIEAYGLPEPASSNVWRVLPVVISESLLPRKTLSALNFFLRRIEDPEHLVPASFDKSTRYLMDLQTAVRARGLRVPKPPRGVTFPAIGKRDIPGLVLSKELPGCVRPGDAVRIQGRTTTGEPAAISLLPSNPAYPTLEAAEPPSARFAATLTPEMEDVYRVQVEGVWPRDEPLPVKVGPIVVTRDCPQNPS